MRDLIWTLIIIWFIYRLVNVFRISASGTRARVDRPTGENRHTREPSGKTPLKKKLDKVGEYVDFEEIR